MKLVATIAASLALARAQEAGMTDMSDMEMHEEHEQPWYAFMEPFVQVQDLEDKMIFKVEEPSMYLLKQKDGMKMNLKTPWYNRKYEVKPKDTSFEFQFKETIPGFSMLNELNFKTSQFAKNVKTKDEEGNTIKTPVGVQNKFVMLGKHQNEGAKFKVENQHNFITDLEGKPQTFSHKSTWDHKFNVEGAQAAMDFMMNQEMMEDIMGEDMDNMTDSMDGQWNPEATGFDAWFTKGGTNMDAAWGYDDNTKEWKSFEWSFRNFADSYGESPDGDWDIQAAGSTEMTEGVYNEEENTWHATYNYESSCNQGWTNNGMVHEHVENLDQCMEMFMAFYNMDFEAIFMDSLDNPCMMTFEVEGSVTYPDEEGTMMENFYKQGMKFTVQSIMNHALEAYMLDSESIMAGMEAVFAPIASVSTEVMPVGTTEEVETSTTFSCMGEPQMTLTWERIIAAHNYNQDMMARKMFNMYKKGEHLVNKMMQKDWESEEFKAELTASLFNMDYVVSEIGDKQREMVQAWQDMECAYPHWDGMTQMGITLHEAVQVKMYAKMSEHVQMMNLAESVRYWDYVKLSQFLYSTDGSMDWKDIQIELWTRSPAEQFQFVADMTNDMGNTIMPMLEIGYPTPEFMYHWIGQEMPAEMTDEDWESLAIAFEDAMPSYEDLVQIAETIRSFEPVEMSNEEIDASMSEMCNAQFNMLIDFHSDMFRQKVEFIQMAKEQTTYWAEKHVEWLKTPRADVEAKFDECHDEVEAMMAEGALWDCEYQVFGAPESSRKYFSELDEACQAQMQEMYPGIESWEFDGIMEADDEFMMDPEDM